MYTLLWRDGKQSHYTMLSHEQFSKEVFQVVISNLIPDSSQVLNMRQKFQSFGMNYCFHTHISLESGILWKILFNVGLILL